MTQQKKEEEIVVVARNRRARFEYSIEEIYEAGIELKGSEVKSVREGKVSISDSYGQPEKGQVYLQNLNIGEYKPASTLGHEPLRRRRLLLHRQEINKLQARVSERGYSLIPLQVYLKKGWVKVEIGVARGKVSKDKREDIKERETRRELARAVSQKAKQYRSSRKQT